MCGFFGISDKSLIKTDLSDVNERGEFNFSRSFGDTFFHQSILPVSGRFAGEHIFENDDFYFTYTGEIYNDFYKFGYRNDTEWLANKIKRRDFNFDDVNGMYAISIYDKNEKTITLIRDPIGQIPLFYYNKNCLIFSNTIKSIATTVRTKLDKHFLKQWHKIRHYTFDNTHYKRIKLFPKGMIITYNLNGEALRSNAIKPKRNNNDNLLAILKKKEHRYISYRATGSIISGGIDSSVITSLYQGAIDVAVTVTNKDKCFVSNNIDNYPLSIPVVKIENDEKTWCEAAIDYIKQSYMIPYTWSYVGYYMIGKKLENVKVLLTGEGADEIFGGYEAYMTDKNKLSKYSIVGTSRHLDNKYKKRVSKHISKFNDLVVTNKYLDQRSFLPCAAIGANISLGMSCIESRNPFLDHSIYYNDAFLHDVDKIRLKKIFKRQFGIELPEKQGFSGYMNELYNYVNNTEIKNDPKDISLWKYACYQIMETV